MKTFNVYNGEYPFDTLLGSVVAETPEDAVMAAKDKFWQAGHAHPVVEELCECQDRAKHKCPEPWEPGCDLGNNEKFAAPAPKVDHGHSAH